MTYVITERTLDFIAQWEGFRSKAYWDSTGGKWTVGYGHTRQVTRDTACTKARAREWMRADCAAAARYLNSLDAGMTQGQWDALVSFAYNAGLGNLKRSTLLRLVRHSAPVEAVAAEFRKWVRSGGVVLEGLVLRREAEAMLYATGRYATREDAIVHIEKRLGKDWRKKVRGK